MTKVKTTKYLIDCAHLDRPQGEHKISYESYISDDAPRMLWEHTYDDLSEAKEKYQELLKSPTLVGICLIEWQCDGKVNLVTGCYGDRHVSRNAKRVIKHHISRSYHQSKYMCPLKREYWVEITIGDWYALKNIKNPLCDIERSQQKVSISEAVAYLKSVGLTPEMYQKEYERTELPTSKIKQR